MFTVKSMNDPSHDVPCQSSETFHLSIEVVQLQFGQGQSCVSDGKFRHGCLDFTSELRLNSVVPRHTFRVSG